MFGVFCRRTKEKETTNIIPFAQSPDSMYSGLKWCNIGPFRGGRANAVSGVVKNDQRFYAGKTWKNIGLEKKKN